MKKKVVFGIMLTVLLTGMLTLAFDIPQVKAEEIGTSRIGRIQLSDNLVPIPSTFVTVIESNTTTWDAEIGSPFVVYDGGLYKMWYDAAPVWLYTVLPKVIAYAESNNGITWFNKQPVHGPVGGYYGTGTPHVIKEAGLYKMWHRDYYEWVAGDWSGYVAYMTSTDGISWPAFMSAGDMKVLSAQGQTVRQGDGYEIWSPCVIHEPAQYVLWYSVADHPQVGVGGPSKIWRATSTDGIVWSNRQLSLPYINATWEGHISRPSVVKEDDGTYTMFYHAMYAYIKPDGTSYSDGHTGSIGIAKSSDGITWTNRAQLLKASDLGVNIDRLEDPYHFRDTDGKRYLYFTYYRKGVPAVGGIVVPVDKFGLLAPYIGLASTILVAVGATVIYVKRVKQRKEKQ